MPIIGSKIGQVYTVLECVGEGGSGSVFRCLQSELNREVAIKLLHPSLLASKDALDRFTREARILSKLHHSNIAQFFSWGMHDDNAPFIAMELITGRSLQTIIEESTRLPWKQALNYSAQMCAAVGEIHKLQIVHRDIKPGNFMVTESDEVKLVDFGLARSTGSHTLTETGLLLGSLHFMSPEACRGQKSDCRADIYSLGCALYSMLYGTPPFQSDSAVGILHKHAQEIPTFSTDVEVPAALVATIAKCLEKDPGNRYQTAEDLLQNLKHIQSHPGDMFTGNAMPNASASKKPKRLQVSLATCAILGCVSVLMWNPTKQFFDKSFDYKHSQATATYSKPHWAKTRSKRIRTQGELTRLISDSYLSKEDKISALKDLVSDNSDAPKRTRGAAYYYLSQLGVSVAGQDYIAKAKALLNSKERTAGEASGEIIAAKELTARIYLQTKDYPKAEKLCTEALNACEEYGPTTPLRIHCLRLLAQIKLANGQIFDLLAVAGKLRDALEQKNQAQAGHFVSAPDGSLLLSPGGSAIKSNQLALSEAYLATGMSLNGQLDEAMEHARRSQAVALPGGDPDFFTAALMCKRINLNTAELMFKSGATQQNEMGRVCAIHLADCLALRNAFGLAREALKSHSKTDDHRFQALAMDVEARCAMHDGASLLDAYAPLFKQATNPAKDLVSLEALVYLSKRLRTPGYPPAFADRLREAIQQFGMFPETNQTALIIENLVKADLPKDALLVFSKLQKSYGFYPDCNRDLCIARAFAMVGEKTNTKMIVDNVEKLLVAQGSSPPIIYSELLQVRAKYLAKDFDETVISLENANKVYMLNGLLCYRPRLALLQYMVHELRREGWTANLVSVSEQEKKAEKLLSNFPPSYEF